MTRDICKALRIQQKFHCPHHTQSSGHVEKNIGYRHCWGLNLPFYNCPLEAPCVADPPCPVPRSPFRPCEHQLYSSLALFPLVWPAVFLSSLTGKVAHYILCAEKIMNFLDLIAVALSLFYTPQLLYSHFLLCSMDVLIYCLCHQLWSVKWTDSAANIF